MALQQGHDKVVALLLENDSGGKIHLPALHIAAKKNDTKAATLLLQNAHNADKASDKVIHLRGWLGSRVVSVLDSGAEGPGFKSQPRRCRVTVLGKLFTPSCLCSPSTKLVASLLRVAG